MDDPSRAVDKASFVEEFSRVFIESGFPRMEARVVAWLMMSDRSGMSSSGLAETLGASKGAISTATRFLVQVGLIERFHTSGERESRFRVNPMAWSDLLAVKTRGMRRVQEMAERGLVYADTPESRAQLEELRDIYAFFEREMVDIARRWKERDRVDRDSEGSVR
jgi:DNA-binding transcriptional regulator GbsR (MarR family)